MAKVTPDGEVEVEVAGRVVVEVAGTDIALVEVPTKTVDYSQIKDMFDNIWNVCTKCGALVANKSVHDEWHER